MVSAVYVSIEQLKEECTLCNGYEKHLNAFKDDNRGVFSYETWEGLGLKKKSIKEEEAVQS